MLFGSVKGSRAHLLTKRSKNRHILTLPSTKVEKRWINTWAKGQVICDYNRIKVHYQFINFFLETLFSELPL